MPSVGFGEIIVILIVALLVFGPKKLPEIGRALGRAGREFRKATSDLTAEFEADEEPPSVPGPANRPDPSAEAGETDGKKPGDSG